MRWAPLHPRHAPRLRRRRNFGLRRGSPLWGVGGPVGKTWENKKGRELGHFFKESASCEKPTSWVKAVMLTAVQRLRRGFVSGGSSGSSGNRTKSRWDLNSNHGPTQGSSFLATLGCRGIPVGENPSSPRPPILSGPRRGSSCFLVSPPSPSFTRVGQDV